MTWRRVRLDWVTSVSRELVDPAALGATEVAHYSIPALDELGGPAIESASSIGSTKLGIRGGEVLVSKLNPRKLRVITTRAHESPALASGEFIPLVPRDIESRFLSYWLQSERTRQDLDGATQSVTRSHQRVSPDLLTKKWLYLPDAGLQRAIADYLDAETARIDALISNKQRLLTLVTQRRQSAVERVVGSGDWPRPALSHLLARRVSDGPHETPDFLEKGVPFLSVDAFSVDGLRFQGCRYISEKDHRRYSLKARPQRGDVLMTKAAAIGRVAMVETEREFNVWSPIAILRPNVALLRSDYLAHILRSEDLQRQMALRATSNTQQNLAMADIGALRIPLPPLALQEQIAASAGAQLRWEQKVRHSISSQIDLLREHRQALITAAVSGELDVPVVAA